MEKLVVTEQMKEAAIAKFDKTEVREIFDSEGISFGEVLFGRPSAWAINEFEKKLERDPLKARQILINATICDADQKKIVNSWAKNSEEFMGAFDGAMNMLPVGKSSAKK